MATKKKRYSGSEGADTYFGSNKLDVIDIIHGNGGSDELHGRRGNDRIFGDGGGDYLYGDAGNDRLYGGAGFDMIYGGIGNDVLYSGYAGGGDADGGALHGGPGNDVLIADSSIYAFYVSMYAGSGNDTLYAGGFSSLGSFSNIMFGESGQDTFVFVDGAFDRVGVVDFEPFIDRVIIQNYGATVYYEELVGGLKLYTVNGEIQFDYLNSIDQLTPTMTIL